jgi:hypothetical protein
MTDRPVAHDALRDALADAMSRHSLIADHHERADLVLADIRHDWPELFAEDGAGTLTDVFRDRVPLTTDEFWANADHIWLNAMQCVRPTERFAYDLGLMIIDKVMRSELRTAPIGTYDGSRAAIVWVNAS